LPKGLISFFYKAKLILVNDFWIYFCLDVWMGVLNETAGEMLRLPKSYLYYEAYSGVSTACV